MMPRVSALLEDIKKLEEQITNKHKQSTILELTAKISKMIVELMAIQEKCAETGHKLIKYTPECQSEIFSLPQSQCTRCGKMVRQK